METQSTNGGGGKEFTMPEAPKGQAIGGSMEAQVSEEKSFTSTGGPSFAAAPVSTAMPEPELYDETMWDSEPMEWEADMDMDPTLYEYDYPVEEWEEFPMEDYMRGPANMDMDMEMPPMDEMDWEEYEIMPVMEEANWEMPEDLSWDELSDPEFYQDQAQEWNEDKDWDALTDPEFYHDQAQEWNENMEFDALTDPEFY